MPTLQTGPAPVQPLNDGVIDQLHIEFKGSGSEYFRIWIVNMLLLFVTLGLYWPWAKVRRLRYFWSHTLIDGDPLGFHGDAKQMFKGWVLIGILFSLYSWASNFSAVAGLLAFLVLAALWPALWRSSMIFRLSNTSWRGLRFRFVGTLRDAYLAHLPPFLVSLPMVILSLWVPTEPKQAPPSWMGGAILIWMVLLLASLPWLLWRVKAYQHRNYALGPLQTDFRASLKSFYGIALKPLLLVLVILALIGVWLWGVVTRIGSDSLRTYMALFLPLLILGLWAFLLFGLQPWIVTQLQNIVWTKTGNSKMRFMSDLQFRKMLGLNLKNGGLMMITMGLYWPFAKIAVARLRLESVYIRSRVDLAALLSSDYQGPKEAAGDAAGDFFGIDVGL